MFTENYLGKEDATFTLNFSTGAAMVLAQYYNFVRFGREGYGYVMGMMKKNANALAGELASSGDFELIGADEEQLPLVAFKLAEERKYDEFDIAWQLTAERGWMVPAYTLPAGRAARDRDARPRQGDAEPRDGGHARRRHRRRVRHARRRRAGRTPASASR